MREPCLCGADDCPRCYPGRRFSTDESEVRERAEELAMDRVADPVWLVDLVNGYELDVWADLAHALELIVTSRCAAAGPVKAASITAAGMAIGRVLDTVLEKATELEMDAARKELRAEMRERPRGRTRYCEEGE